MQKPGGSKRVVRALGVGVLFVCLVLSMGLASTSNATEASSEPTPAAATTDPSPLPTAEPTTTPPAITPERAGTEPPYGAAFPITLETNFSRPAKSISSQQNSDFSLLNDLERLIRGTYKSPNGATRSVKDRNANRVYLSISRMENAHRVGRELIAAAKHGVHVEVIHGRASQSKESRALATSLTAATYRGKRYGQFKICSKGKSLACLSTLNGAIMHSKLLYITTWGGKNATYNRNGEPAKGVIWTGSANLGGPSGERTWNNGISVYNDRKLMSQVAALWDDMWRKRNIGNDYVSYARDHTSRYGYKSDQAELTRTGYTSTRVRKYGSYGGAFYSNLADITIYQTPIYATPGNSRDPVINALNRVVPDGNCHIRVQNNRFKYRRIAVAQKLVELADKGCTVEAIAFRDDLKVNRVAHCQQWLRICMPILDVFRTANVRIVTSYAKPHDKIMTIDAIMGPNRLNPEEVQANGRPYPTAGARTKFVQTGSSNMTGSNLVVSDEIFIESTDPQVFGDYLQHWKAIWKSYEHKDVAY